MKHEENSRTVLQILKDEMSGDTEAALKKMSEDYSMTWVYQAPDGTLFPRSTNEDKKGLEEIYAIKGREYDIKHIAEGIGLVMVEMVESYPDPKTGEIYRTPLVLVLEMENGKIRKGRHYCDPKISYLHLSEKEANKAFE